MDSVRTICLLLAAMFGLAASSATAQNRPSGADQAYRLLAAARLATGGPAWDRVHVLHEQMNLTIGGLDGTLECWIDPAHGRYASHYTLGPDRGADGWDGQNGWTSDWGGRLHRPDDKSVAQARASAVWHSFAWLFAERNGIAAHLIGQKRDPAGRNFDVVGLVPRGGGVLELWLDRQTSLPGRLIIRGEPDLVASFDEYREVEGLNLPATVRISAGRGGNDRMSVLEVAEIDPPLITDPFVPPPPAPPDYRFVDNERHAHVTLTTTGDAFLIDVMVDGKGPYRFALDTGASNAMDSALAAELGLPVAGAFSALGAGEQAVKVGLTRAARVEIGDVTLNDQLFRVLPISQIVAHDHPPYRGLLGFEFFDRFVVTFNQDRRRLELDEPAGWRFRGDAVPVPFGFHGRTPVVDGVIDLVPGRFTLDTGQANSVTLYRPFIQRVGIQRKYVAKMTAVVGEGVGGPIRAEVTRGRELMLGTTSVSFPVLFLSLQKSGAFSDPELAGNIGDGVFARFNTTFDYARHQVYLEPVNNYGQGDSLKLMVVKRGLLGLEVLSVLPGGPLADAGVKRDDIIESIDYKEAIRIDDPQLQRIFRRPAGTRIPMTIRSDGELKHIVVVLGETV
ncbi:MAG: aspartyl protease family protein [Aliidongia sp.]